MATKGKKMNLKQAAEYLQDTPYKYGVPALKKAAQNGKLKAQLKTDAPKPYYLCTESDLLAWASDASLHKPGRKTE